MTHEERVQAVIDFGFTERQARFLVLVLRHAGVCVPRQYASFAGIANGGRRCNAFFDKLVRRGYAHESGCVHNRARLYHLHHKPLYHAIGEATSRYRRRVSPRLAVERLMLLDAVLTMPDLEWLTTASEKAAYLARLRTAAGADATAEQPADTPSETAPRTLSRRSRSASSQTAERAAVPRDGALDGELPELPPRPCGAAASGADMDLAARVSTPARPRLRHLSGRHPRGAGIAAAPRDNRRAAVVLRASPAGGARAPSIRRRRDSSNVGAKVFGTRPVH